MLTKTSFLTFHVSCSDLCAPVSFSIARKTLEVLADICHLKRVKKNEILKKEKKKAKLTSRKFIMKQTVRMLIKKKPTAEGHFTSTSQF